VIIKCSTGNGELEFSEQEGLCQNNGSEYFRVTIRSQYMSAFTRVYAFDPFDYNLTKFFKELAENWKGFDGEKVWESLEGEFKLACASDRLGHFGITVTIRNDLDTLSIKTIYVEAGQLEKIAAEVKTFFDVSART
jgi:hypothetical protein